MEHGEGEEDCNAEGDLLVGVGWKEENEEDEEGHERAWNHQVDGEEERFPSEVNVELQVRVDVAIELPVTVLHLHSGKNIEKVIVYQEL